MATEKQIEEGRATRATIYLYLAKFEQGTPRQIAAGLGLTNNAVHYQLQIMKKAGDVFSCRLNGYQGEATWFVGEDPNKSPDHEIVRIWRKAWAPHHVRDSLVTALFGARVMA